jgi:invasion protein IalB
MTMKNRVLAGAVALTMAFSVAAGTARAANPTPIDKFGDWIAQTYDDSGKTLCYATSAPKKQAGNFKSRGNPYIAITHAPQSGVRDQVSYIAGYELKPGSDVKLTIGKQTFSLSVLQKDRAWAKDADIDKTLIEAMRKGNSMTVKGTSSRGTDITDTYSLTGFTKAYGAIGAACKIQ